MTSNYCGKRKNSIGGYVTYEMKMQLNDNSQPKVVRTNVNDLIMNSSIMSSGENTIKDLQNQLVISLNELRVDSPLIKISQVMALIQKMTNLLYKESTNGLLTSSINKNTEIIMFFSLLISNSSVIALALASSNDWLLIIWKWLHGLTLPSLPCPDQTTEQGQILSLIFNLLDILPLPYPLLKPSPSCIKFNYLFHSLQICHLNQWTSKLATGIFFFFFFC